MLIYGESKALQGDLEEGIDSLKKALSTYTKLGNLEGIARTRLTIGRTFLYVSIDPRPSKALRYIKPALSYYRGQGLSSNLCLALLLTADAYWETGRHDKAKTLALEGLELASALNDKDSEGRFSLILGLVYRDKYQLREAQAAFDKAFYSLTCFAEPQDMMRVIHERALLELLMGDLPAAERFLRETIAIAGIIHSSTKIRQIQFTASVHLAYIQHIQDKQVETSFQHLSSETENYSPQHFSYLNPLFFLPKDPKAAFREVEGWLRASLLKFKPYYMAPVIGIVIEQMLAAGFTKGASRWTALALRLARSKDLPGWEAIFYGHRAVIMAKLGRKKEAEVCSRRAREIAEEPCRWIPAWVAWADGLIARLEGNNVEAEKNLRRSIELFNQIGHRHRMRQVEADLSNFKISPISSNT